jgi:hypothetical protein
MVGDTMDNRALFVTGPASTRSDSSHIHRETGGIGRRN